MDASTPASKAQTWALFCIYKKDFRDQHLTYEQASEMIKNAPAKHAVAKENPGATKPKTFKDYMLSDEVVDRLTKKIMSEMGISSVVMNDTSLVKDDGKRYVFLGMGCGFSYIKFDKRSKRAADIVKQSEALKPVVEARIVKKLGSEFIGRLRACGNPIQAHFCQNLNYKSAYNYIVTGYMESVGITKVSVMNWDD